MKITVDLYEFEEGSDDPRAIQGGGGDRWRFWKRVTCSAWLVDSMVRAYENRYGDGLIVRRAGV